MPTVARARRIRRPAPRFPLSRVYGWKTVVVKVWTRT